MITILLNNRRTICNPEPHLLALCSLSSAAKAAPVITTSASRQSAVTGGTGADLWRQSKIFHKRPLNVSIFFIPRSLLAGQRENRTKGGRRFRHRRSKAVPVITTSASRQSAVTGGTGADLWLSAGGRGSREVGLGMEGESGGRCRGEGGQRWASRDKKARNGNSSPASPP
jgi:hypothetical protein